MENGYQNQKIVLSGNWYNQLLQEIQKNNDYANSFSNEEKDIILKRNQRIQEKLDKYKKVSNNNEIYYYFFIKELRDLFWILLENLVVLNEDFSEE